MEAEKIILLSTNQKEEAEKLIDMVEKSSVEEQREMLAYMQGYRAGMTRAAATA